MMIFKGGDHYNHLSLYKAFLRTQAIIKSHRVNHILTSVPPSIRKTVGSQLSDSETLMKLITVEKHPANQQDGHK